MSALLEVNDVSVVFGGLRALDAVSITVEPGQTVGLIGPNGAGKTTLFNVISGLQAATSGRVAFRGEDISGLAPHRRSALGIGRSFQNLGLMTDESVEVNVLAAQHLSCGYPAFGPIATPWRSLRRERELRERVTTVLTRFGLDRHRHDRVADLSFGVARFVELAAVLALGPDLLLLDEPTTCLDPGEVDRLVTAVSALGDTGHSVLVIAHNVSFVMDVCNWVYVLAAGQLLAEGPPEEIQRDERVQRVYMGIEA
jgi:branched-chain amino acid transport system ATP-binding protein